jgi:hypothetical protein
VLRHDELLALVAELQRQVAALQQRMDDLTASNKALRAENKQLKWSGKRQAVPLVKGSRVSQPKQPRPKRGTGLFRDREAPPPEAVTEPPVDVPVTLEDCPVCGGFLEEERVGCADRTELPECPRPRITPHRVQVCRCTVCGHQVRGQHPDVAPDQAEATAHRVGERVMAAAQALPNGIGIPVRKVSLVVAALTGV